MRGRVGILAVIWLLLLAGTFLYVPVRWRVSAGYTPAGGIAGGGYYIEDPVSPSVRYRWTWARERREDGSRYPPVPMMEEALNWPLIAAEHVVLLLLGGIVLTWVIRRERRRRAEAEAALTAGRGRP
ncbi:MAG: hypothetical protein L0216_00095 [Planctomycetales bacterium]|nr:hypothetical protein [Planctomycetales bacterium]